jgi:hypothetical protein
MFSGILRHLSGAYAAPPLLGGIYMFLGFHGFRPVVILLTRAAATLITPPRPCIVTVRRSLTMVYFAIRVGHDNPRHPSTFCPRTLMELLVL